MNTKPKTRNIRNEYIFSLIYNFFILFVVFTASAFILPETGPIGSRTMIAMYTLDCVISLSFMYFLEKYTVSISDLSEKNIITILSSLYTFVIMCIINLIFFSCSTKLIADSAIAVAKIITVSFGDYIFNKVISNEKKFKKPTLLIIDSEAKNFSRMKRIKYGVINKYNSWYENLDGKTKEEFKSFIDAEIDKYDALCVLDGLNDDEYHIAVNAASEKNKELFIVPKIVDVGKTNARPARFDDVLTLYMPNRSLNAFEFFLKRLTDIVISVIGLAFAAIPMLIIALLIKLTSPGPVFYKQLRLTKDKKEFYIYKFRTMVPDAEKLSGPKFAEKDDPRITPIGKILRACRLDELPQILNILKGDMSVVGPRPERPVFIEQFEKEIENYDYRFEVKAGLTSLSHVYGRYSTYIHDRTYYDLFYITHYSLFLDFKIILLTTKIMFLKSAAEGEDDFKQKTVAESESGTEVKIN